jgi:hypothetical protein
VSLLRLGIAGGHQALVYGRQSLAAQAAGILTCDFVHADTVESFSYLVEFDVWLMVVKGLIWTPSALDLAYHLAGEGQRLTVNGVPAIVQHNPRPVLTGSRDHSGHFAVVGRIAVPALNSIFVGRRRCFGVVSAVELVHQLRGDVVAFMSAGELGDLPGE